MSMTSGILQQTEWLYTRIYQNPWMFIDLWSFVHFWSGFGLIILAGNFNIRRPLAIMVLILACYTIVEIGFLYFTLSVFRPETITDQFTDIFIGVAGGLFAKFLLDWAARHWNKNEQAIVAGIAFYTAITIAFIWVGFYRYRYNYDHMNTDGINAWALLCWTVALSMVIIVYHYLQSLGMLKALLLTFAIYFSILFPLEYYGYYFAGMKEVSIPGAEALVFGLIHGSPALHLFYMIAPAISIGAFHLAKWLVGNAVKSRVFFKIPGNYQHNPLGLSLKKPVSSKPIP